MEWGYVPNTQTLFTAEIIPSKHHCWSILGITIAVCQIQMILTLIPDGDIRKAQKFYSERK